MRQLKIALIGCCAFAFMAATAPLVSASPGGAKAKTEMFQKFTGDQVCLTMVINPVLDVPATATELPAAVAVVSDRSVIKLPVLNEISLRPERPGWRSAASDNLYNSFIDIRRKPPLIL